VNLQAFQLGETCVRFSTTQIEGLTHGREVNSDHVSARINDKKVHITRSTVKHILFNIIKYFQTLMAELTPDAALSS
jgi:hypothetical protein